MPINLTDLYTLIFMPLHIKGTALSALALNNGIGHKFNCKVDSSKNEQSFWILGRQIHPKNKISVFESFISDYA